VSYQMKKYEWDLTKEEQEKAKFIHEWVVEANKMLVTKGIAAGPGENGGFEAFKARFYGDVRQRLQIPFSRSGFGCFSISDDLTKLFAYKVEKIESKPTS